MGGRKWTYHKQRILPVLYLFEKFVSGQEPSIKSWFHIPTSQMSIFILLLSLGVLFEGVFSLIVSLKESFSKNNQTSKE